MSTTKRYEGPLKAGMKIKWHTRFRGEEATLADNFYDCDYLRREIHPVRPADTDRAAWELFLPDGPLEDTGPKAFKVGQVWALGYPTMGYMVGLISGPYNGSRETFSFKRLAGDYSDRLEHVTSGCFVSRVAVMLFDAPESTAKPTRRLAAGWVRDDKDVCDVMANGEHGFGSISEWCRARAPYCKSENGRYVTSCDAHAEAMGVFAKDDPNIPGTDLRDAIWGGTKAAERVVGNPYEHKNGSTDKEAQGAMTWIDAHVVQSGTRAATATLLANLEREKAPKRELPRVRDIYAPGVMLDGSEL